VTDNFWLSSQVWETALGMKLQTPFERVPYRHCMDHYGSDKPDRRFGFLLQNVSEGTEMASFLFSLFLPRARTLIRMCIVFASTQIGILANELKSGGSVRAVNIKALADVSDKEIEEIQREAKRAPGKVYIYAVSPRNCSYLYLAMLNVGSDSDSSEEWPVEILRIQTSFKNRN